MFGTNKIFNCPKKKNLQSDSYVIVNRKFLNAIGKFIILEVDIPESFEFSAFSNKALIRITFRYIVVPQA